MRLFDRALDCLAPDQAGALPIHATRPAGTNDMLAGLAGPQAAYVRGSGFTGAAGQVVLLPGEAGVAGAALGLGEKAGLHVWGALPPALPAGTLWMLASMDGTSQDGAPQEGASQEGAAPARRADAALGWMLGAYRFDALRSVARPAGPRLYVGTDPDVIAAVSAGRAVWLARDLINIPANLLGPMELAEAAATELTFAGARIEVVSGDALAARYPVLHAVGRGAVRQSAVVVAHWEGPGAGQQAPLLSLCGKGVCFDTGGYDLKPSAGMLRMKKDMGGAAIALGLARMIIDAAWPVRLEVRLGCVENMVSGDAMRPLDVLTTRAGVTIEVGDTDAEGRLVLCDLLAEAAIARPAALLDFATLTGAARVALGPDVPALFSNDDVLAARILQMGARVHDPVWRLPLWECYTSWLDSSVADTNNVSDKSQAGAIIAALFLHRFVPKGIRWAHFDLYGWNDASRYGRPAGGEAQGLRAAFEGLKQDFWTGPT